MKKIFLTTTLSIYALIIFSQVEFGVKAGLNSIDLVTDGIIVDDGINNFKIDFQNAEYGHHFGLYSRVKFLGMYVEPGLIFNSNKVNYRITNYFEGQEVFTVLSEKYSTLDIPLNIGVKAGVFRLYGGAVAHIHIDNSSDLYKIKNYSEKFKNANFGYQAGFGFDIWKLRLDLAYEGNLSVFGDHISIGSNDYSFGTSASRILGTVGYKF